MALTTQDAVTALLQRTLVYDKVRGHQAAEVEGAAVLDTVALTLLLQPRSVYCLYHYARNGLLAALDSAIAEVDSAQSYADASLNVSYALTDTKSLKQASLALGQVQSQGHLSTTSGPYQNFLRSVDAFLEKSLAKNVRVKGTTSLKIPGAEAVPLLLSSIESLVEQHDQIRSRLFDLEVALTNFEQFDLNTFLGAAASSRVQAMLDDMVSSLTTDRSASQSRDFTTQLIAAKTVLRLLVSPPSATTPKVDTARALPNGRVLKAKTVEYYPAQLILYDADTLEDVPNYEGLAYVGDIVQLGANSYTVTAVRNVLEVSPDTTTWDGNVTVYSGLVQAIESVRPVLTTALSTFRVSAYFDDLAPLVRAAAPLSGQPTPSARTATLLALSNLRAVYVALRESVATNSTLHIEDEAGVVRDVLDTLRQRGFGRAKDWLLRGKIVDVFTMNWQTASYAGAVTSAVEEFVASNVTWPNRALDQGMERRGFSGGE